MEQIKIMMDMMSNDEAFGKEMTALMKTGDVAAMIALAKKKDVVFTEADWVSYSDWSKSIDAKNESKELAPEELDNVSGGLGVPWDPGISGCWCHAFSEARENRNGHMRKKCNQFACKAFIQRTPLTSSYWALCKCWGTDRCVDNWHYEEDCPS